jgi:hypothetical protein
LRPAAPRFAVYKTLRALKFEDEDDNEYESNPAPPSS